MQPDHLCLDLAGLQVLLYDAASVEQQGHINQHWLPYRTYLDVRLKCLSCDSDTPA